MKSELLNEKVRRSYIRNHPLFKNLPIDNFNGILGKARLVKVGKKTPFLLNSDPVSRIYFLGSGAAKQVSSGGKGDHMVTNILVDGDIFGDISFTGTRAHGYITGIKPNTFIFYFVADHFKKLLQQDHLLALNYAEAISTKLRYLESRHIVWTSKDARQRLLFFFQGWTACDGTRSQEGIILDNYFSLSDIADFLGVSRQFMYTMLKELREEGLLDYSRKKIFISPDFLAPFSQKQAV